MTTRPSFPALSGIAGGAIAGASACVLAAQFAVLYPTGIVMISFVCSGAATSAAAAEVTRRASAETLGRWLGEAESPSEWRGTYVVPEPGLMAYAGPNESQTSIGRLDPWLSVEVIERWGDWALVRCSNNWTGWIDSRTLQEVAR